MSFGLLAEKTLAEFIATERAPDKLWIFVHIPKTAGSSFASELGQTRRPYRNIHVDYRDTRTPHAKKMDNAITQFVKETKTEKFMSCSGHFDMAQALKIKMVEPEARVITFVRNPIARVISDYRYQRTPAHPPYKDFIREYPDILSYIESPESQDKMARFLAPGRNKPVSEVINFVDQAVTFIGLVEMYPMCFNIISRLFGDNGMPHERKRKTEANPDNTVDLTTELKRRIREKNRRDVELYEHVRGIIMARRDEWTLLRSHNRAAGTQRADSKVG